jgi:uroporphyrinogen-III synthase
MSATDRTEAELAGWRVAVTRPRAGTDQLADALRRRGAIPVVLPLVRTVPARDPAPLVDAARQLGSYDWVVLTSANGARFLRDAMRAAGVGGSALRGRVAAVGPATAAATAELLGWSTDVVPPHYVGSALTSAMAEVAPLPGARVLWPRAREAREELPRDLRSAGVALDAPEAYGTEPVPESAGRIARLAAAGSLHAVTLTSPSAARCLAGAQPPGSLVIAVIGPSTAAVAREHGLTVHVEPAQHTVPGLVAALARHVRDLVPPDPAEH